MNSITPKQFIQNVLISELESLNKTNPFVALSLMAIGTEFLGKCIDPANEKLDKGSSVFFFQKAIFSLESFKAYKSFAKRYNFRNSMRNGFAHNLLPINNISLSSKDPAKHLVVTKNILNINIEDFFNDFKNACNEVIKMDFNRPDDKMNKPFVFSY